MCIDSDEYQHWRREADSALGLMNLTLTVRTDLKRRVPSLDWEERHQVIREMIQAYGVASAYWHYASARAALVCDEMTIEDMLDLMGTR